MLVSGFVLLTFKTGNVFLTISMVMVQVYNYTFCSLICTNALHHSVLASYTR
jgi:hypothetical protein